MMETKAAAFLRDVSEGKIWYDGERLSLAHNSVYQILDSFVDWINQDNDVPSQADN